MVSISIGAIFSLLASIMAFLISYNEYQHHYPSSKLPLRMSLSTAVFTFIFFLLLSIVGGVFLNLTIAQKGR